MNRIYNFLLDLIAKIIVVLLMVMGVSLAFLIMGLLIIGVIQTYRFLGGII